MKAGTMTRFARALGIAVCLAGCQGSPQDIVSVSDRTAPTLDVEPDQLEPAQSPTARDGPDTPWTRPATQGNVSPFVAKLPCGSATTRYASGGVGRPADDATPNGFLELLDEITESWGVSSCAQGEMFRETSIEEYEVEGGNLIEVSNDIFDPETGKGTADANGRRCAAHTYYSFRFAWKVVAYDQCTKTMTVELTDFSWTNLIRLPKWVPPDGTPLALIEEWTRFRAALETHENGHVGVHDVALAAIKQIIIGQRVTASGKPPRYSSGGVPIGPEGQAAHDAICAALNALVRSQTEFQNMLIQSHSYDAPPDPENPTGTNHGVTQGATLDTEPDRMQVVLG